MDAIPSVELLESTHRFPGRYHVKAIGEAGDGFQERVVEVVASQLAKASSLEVSSRSTKGGRHVALTLDFEAESAAEVQKIYDRIRSLPGLTLLL